MKREVFSSIEEMLAPETLGELTGQLVTDVHYRPMNPDGSNSGSRFQVVEINEDHSRGYVLKHVSRAWDWQMRTSDAHYCRETLAWQTGLLDRLPPEIDCAIIACAANDSGCSNARHRASLDAS